MENTVKEVREEAGLDVEVVRLVAVLDKTKSNPSRSAHHVTKVFYLCRSLGGQFQANSETLTSAYFSLGDLPTLSLGKNTVEQIALCFEAYQAEHWETRFE